MKNGFIVSGPLAREYRNEPEKLSAKMDHVKDAWKSEGVILQSWGRSHENNDECIFCMETDESRETVDRLTADIPVNPPTTQSYTLAD